MVPHFGSLIKAGTSGGANEVADDANKQAKCIGICINKNNGNDDNVKM